MKTLWEKVMAVLTAAPGLRRALFLLGTYQTLLALLAPSWLNRLLAFILLILLFLSLFTPRPKAG